MRACAQLPQDIDVQVASDRTNTIRASLREIEITDTMGTSRRAGASERSNAIPMHSPACVRQSHGAPAMCV